MKKTLSAVAVMLVAHYSLAQYICAPELGVNMSTMTPTGSSPAKHSFKPGLVAGIDFYVRISPSVSFQPGLFYENGGGVFKSAFTSTLNLNTVELPMDFWYRFSFNNQDAFCMGAGVYGAANRSGDLKWTSFTDPYYGVIPGGSRKVRIGNYPNDEVKVLDGGFALNAMYLFRRGPFIKARYQFGVVNLNPMPPGEDKLKSSAISISTGFFLRSRYSSESSRASKGEQGVPEDRPKKPRKKINPYVED